MIYPVCAIRDSKIGFYPPTVEQSVPAAKRNFAMMINQSDGLTGYAPGDFDFYHVADFDTEKGEMSPVHPIIQLCTGLGVYNEK